MPVMDRYLTLLQALGVPLIGLLGSAFAARGPRRELHALERLAALRDRVGQEASGILDPLSADLASMVAYKERRRLFRSLDGGALAALIIVLMVGSAALYGGLAIGHWWSIATGGAAALFTLALAWVGVLQLWKYPDGIERPSFKNQLLSNRT